MKKYLVNNIGCDDETLFEIELTNEELQIITKFIELNNKNSTGGCQPIIELYDEYYNNDNGEPRTGIWINHNLLKGHRLIEYKEQE